MKPPKPCPSCGSRRVRVLYMGLPGVLCTSERCSRLTGPAWLATAVVFSGAFVDASPGYWRALWWWLIGKEAR